jgi:hypothetical protein
MLAASGNADALEVFTDADVNHDGVLSELELSAALGARHLAISPSRHLAISPSRHPAPPPFRVPLIGPWSARHPRLAGGRAL